MRCTVTAGAGESLVECGRVADCAPGAVGAKCTVMACWEWLATVNGSAGAVRENIALLLCAALTVSGAGPTLLKFRVTSALCPTAAEPQSRDWVARLTEGTNVVIPSARSEERR